MKNLIFLYFILVGFILFSQNDEVFYFVQISDTHLGEFSNDDRTEKIVNSINGLPFDIKFVAHTGDVFQNNVADKKVRSEAKEIFSKLKYPVFFVPGNHDILASHYEKTRDAFIEFAGYTDTVVLIEDKVFLFFYTEPLRDEVIKGTSEKFDFVEKILDNYKDKQIIIFHHTPSVSDFYSNETNENWSKENSKRWKELLNGYTINAIVAGHFHRNEFHWVGEIPLYVASSVAGFWGRQASYKVFKYQNNKLSFWTVYIE
ncbi:MAG: metallophosphoesterase [Bacteroidota bacterium]